VNILNRVLMILSILVLIALIAFIVVRPDLANDYAKTGVAYLGDSTTFPNSTAGNQAYTIFVLAGGGALLILLILFVLEVRRPRRKTVRILTQNGGHAHLEVSSVAQSLEYRVDELAGVRQVKTRITSRGKDVDVALDLDTSPSVNIPVLTDQITALCHDIVEGQLGIRIHSRPIINIKHAPYPRGTMPSTRPLGAEPLSATPPTANTRPGPAGQDQDPGAVSAPTSADLTTPEPANETAAEELVQPPKRNARG
jgi:hypothetical protein